MSTGLIYSFGLVVSSIYIYFFSGCFFFNQYLLLTIGSLDWSKYLSSSSESDDSSFYATSGSDSDSSFLSSFIFFYLSLSL